MSIYKLSYSFSDNGVILRRAAMVQASNIKAAEDKFVKWFLNNIGVRADFRFTGRSIVSNINILIP